MGGLDLEDLRLLRHAVGFDGKRPGYRNRYTATYYTDEHRRWWKMVDGGWADCSGQGGQTTRTFRATAKGCEAAGLTPEQTKEAMA